MLWAHIIKLVKFALHDIYVEWHIPYCNVALKTQILFLFIYFFFKGQEGDADGEEEEEPDIVFSAEPEELEEEEVLEALELVEEGQ